MSRKIPIIGQQAIYRIGSDNVCGIVAGYSFERPGKEFIEILDPVRNLPSYVNPDWVQLIPLPAPEDWQQERVEMLAERERLVEALKAIEPFIPKTSASDGGAARYSEAVKAADMVRAALSAAKARGES